jgi:hypothetical protein
MRLALSSLQRSSRDLDEILRPGGVASEGDIISAIICFHWGCSLCT